MSEATQNNAPHGEATQGEESALSLLQLLAVEDGQSIHRVARRLGLGLSQLQRLLSALGDDPHFDGLDLVVQRHDGQRLRLWLTDKGKRLCGTA